MFVVSSVKEKFNAVSTGKKVSYFVMHMTVVMMTMMKVTTIAICLRPFSFVSVLSVAERRAYCLPVGDIFLFVHLYY